MDSSEADSPADPTPDTYFALTGRGVGTHSMKLLGERYLHGTVGFTSQAPHGTTFWIDLPEKWPEEEMHGQ